VALFGSVHCKPQRLAKFNNLKHFRHGIHFEKPVGVKITTSHKDLLLLLGIVVAIIIAITSWHHSSTLFTTRFTPTIEPQIHATSLAGKSGYALMALARSWWGGIYSYSR
jgi:hypothetical protein